jgi:GntR family histidine utilization transcriptional repressor
MAGGIVSKAPKKTGRPPRTTNETPIYVGIQREIENKIMSGEWGPGHRIPPENELVIHYGCSRMTVNKALSNLVAAGLVVRKPRSGTTVAPTRLIEPLMTIQDIRAEVMSLDRTYSFEILSRSVRKATDATDANYIGVPVGTPMIVFEVMHFADGLPFALETRQINLTTAPEAENADFTEFPPGTWLLRNFTWTEAEHSMRAIAADAVIARSLKVDRGAPCMSLARRTWRNSDFITFVRFIYPGDRHRFVLKFLNSELARTL